MITGTAIDRHPADALTGASRPAPAFLTTIATNKTTVKGFIRSIRWFFTVFPDPDHTDSQPDDLSGVHDIVRVERLLDAAHNRNRLAVFGYKEINLAIPDTVFTGAGAFHF